jgi:hypothetical protein
MTKPLEILLEVNPVEVARETRERKHGEVVRRIGERWRRDYDFTRNGS